MLWAQRAISHIVEEDNPWKIMTPNSWNVAVNAKTEMNNFEQLNYGSKCLKLWLWPLMGEVALKAYNSKHLWKKVVALNA